MSSKVSNASSTLKGTSAVAVTSSSGGPTSTSSAKRLAKASRKKVTAGKVTTTAASLPLVGGERVSMDGFEEPGMEAGAVGHYNNMTNPNRTTGDSCCEDSADHQEQEDQIIVHVVPPSSPVTLKETLTDPEDEIDYHCHPPEEHDPTDPTSASTSTPGGSVVPFESPSQVSYLDDEEECSEDCEDEEEEISSEELGDEEEDLEDEDEDGDECISDEISEEEVQASNPRKPLPQHRPQLPVVERTYNNKRRGRTPGSSGLNTGNAANVIKRVRGIGGLRASKCNTGTSLGAISKSKSIVSSLRKRRTYANTNPIFLHNTSSDEEEVEDEEDEEVEDEEDEDELGDEYLERDGDESDEEDEDGIEPPGFLLSTNRDPSALQNIPPDAQARLEAFFEAAGFTDGKLMSDPESLRKLTLTVSSALGEASAAINRMRDSQRKSIEEGRSDSLEEGDSLLALACSSGYFELARVLLAMGANVDDRGSKGDLTPLMDAASQGHLEIARLLLSHGADVNAQSACGNSALMYACASGHVAVVEDLLKAGAHVEDNNENGHTPLMEAASAGHVEVAKLLLAHGAGINTHSNEFKESALTVACYKGHLEMVRFLLEAGADQQHKTDEMHTALMEASMDGHVEVARLLLDSGAQVNMPADSFESPLTLAACGGHVELAELLLERGANIEEVNDEGYTPLMEAAREGHLCVVKTLIQHHAKVNAKTEETQETALTLAACGGFLDVVDLLLKAGAEIELGASTPLMEASQEGHIQVVRFLIEKGADIFRENAAHDIALSFAAENGHLEIVQLFVDMGCNPEHLSEGGRSPLMKAARGGHVEVIKYLLSKKADVNRQTTTNDHTPLSMACAGGHLPAVELLVAVGANPYHKLKDNSTMVIEAARGGHTAVIRSLLDYLPPNSKPTAAKAQSTTKQIHTGKVAAAGQGVKQGTADPKSTQQVKSSVLRKCRSTSTLDSSVPTTTPSANEPEQTPKAPTDDPKVIAGSKQTLPVDEDSSDPELPGTKLGVRPVTIADPKLLSGKGIELTVTGGPHKQPPPPTTAKKQPVQSAGVCYDCSKQSAPQNFQQFSTPGHVHVKRPAAVEAVTAPQQSLQSTSITAGSVMPTSPSAFTPFPSSGGPPLVASQVTAATAISERPKLKSKPRKSSQIQNQAQGSTSTGTSPGSSSEKSQVLSPVGSPGTISSVPQGNPPVAQTPATTTKPQVVSQETPTSTGMLMELQVQQVLTTAGNPIDLKDVKLDPKHLSQIFAQHQQQFLKKGAAMLGQGNLDLVSGSMSAAGSTTTTTTTVVVTHGDGETETIFNGENLPPGANEAIMNAAAAAFPLDCFPLPQMGHTGEVHVQSYQVAGSGDNATTMQTTTIINAATSLNNFQQQILLPHPHHPPPLPAAIAAAAAAAGLVPASGAPPPGAMKGVTKKDTPLQAKAAPPTAAPPKISGTSAPPGQPRIPVNQVPPVSSLAAPVGQKKQLAKRSRPLAQGGSCSRQSNQQTQTHAHAHGHGKHNQSVASTQTTITGQQVNPNHFDVNHATESSGETSLSIAAASGHYEVVEFLLGRKANIEHRDKKGCTPLILASDSGFDKVVELLLSRGADIEAQSERTKDTALSLACTKGRYEVVEALIKKGANKEHRNVSDYTPLSLAASGGYVNIIKLLLQNGAEINSRTGSKLGISPLMLAAMNGNTAAVKLLLDMGSDINAQIETNKNTALTLACFQGRQEVVSLLLERKANLEHRAKTGLTPLMEAANGGYTEVGKILIERGADVNAAPVPATKDTALTIAADKGHYRFVELLLSQHAMVEVRNKKGCTPLWLACNGGHLDVAQILFKHRADLDVQDNRKVSCLMTAFRKGHVKLIRWIVKHVQQFPSDGEMQRFYASVQGEPDLLKKCEQCGEFVKQAKDKQALEANKNASILLEELDLEKSREESKRQAAARRREKKKKKKLEKKQGPIGDQEDECYDQDEEEDEGINTMDSGIDANSLGSNSSTTGKNKENVSTKIPQVDGVEEQTLSAKSRKRRNRKERERQNQLISQKTSVPVLPVSVVHETNKVFNCVPLMDAKDILREKDNKMAACETPQLVAESKPNTKTKDKKTKRDDTTQVSNKEQAAAAKVSQSGNTFSATKKTNKDSSKDTTLHVFESSTNSNSRKLAANFDATDSSIFSSFGYSQPSFAKTVTSGAGSSGAGKSGRKDDGWKEVTRNFTSSKSKKVIVPSSVISRVIGRGGCNINAIREATGAHIEVEKQQKGQVQLERTIQIKGTVESTKQAYALITALMNEPDLDVKKLIPLSSTSATSTHFATGTFSASVGSVSTSSQRSTNPSVSNTISPTSFDNIPFSTFVASSVQVAGKSKGSKHAPSPPVISQVSPTVKKPTPTNEGNSVTRGTTPTPKLFIQNPKPLGTSSNAISGLSTGFAASTTDTTSVPPFAKSTQHRGSIPNSNGLGHVVQGGNQNPSVSAAGPVSISQSSPIPSSSSPGLGSPTNSMVGQTKEPAVLPISSCSPVHGTRNSVTGCSVIGPPGSGRANSVAETVDPVTSSAQQSQALEYSPFNYTFSKTPGAGWLPGELPPNATGGLNNFGSPTSQTMGSPLGQIGSVLTHNPVNSPAARAMNFASVAASGIPASSLSTATAQMTHAGGQHNGSLVGSLGAGLTNSVSLGGKGICDSLLETELPKGDASKAPGYRGNAGGSPVLRPLQQQNQTSVENVTLSSPFQGIQAGSSGMIAMSNTQPLVGFGGPGRNPGMNMGGGLLPSNFGMGGFGQEIGSGIPQGGYTANRLNPRAPCFTLPQHSKLTSPTQPPISLFQQTIPPIHNQQLHNSYKLNNSYGMRNSNMIPGARQGGSATSLNIPGWNPYGNESTVVDLQNLAVLAASTGTLDPQMMFPGVDPLVHDNSQQQKPMKPDGRLPRPIGGERLWKNSVTTNAGAGNLNNVSPFNTMDCMDSNTTPQSTTQPTHHGQGWMGFAPPFPPVSNQNPNNGMLGNHQRGLGGGDARNFLGRRFIDEVETNRIAELQQMIDGHRMMNGGLGPPPPMHLGGNIQHPGMMFPYGPPIDSMEPHLTTKVDQHTNSWEPHFHMEDKHNVGWNPKWGN